MVGKMAGVRCRVQTAVDDEVAMQYAVVVDISVVGYGCLEWYVSDSVLSAEADVTIFMTEAGVMASFIALSPTTSPLLRSTTQMPTWAFLMAFDWQNREMALSKEPEAKMFAEHRMQSAAIWANFEIYFIAYLDFFHCKHSKKTLNK